MKDNVEPCLMDAAIIPRKRSLIHGQSQPISHLVHQRENLKNALDSILQICNNKNIRPKMKLVLIENISGLALGLNAD